MGGFVMTIGQIFGEPMTERFHVLHLRPFLPFDGYVLAVRRSGGQYSNRASSSHLFLAANFIIVLKRS